MARTKVDDAREGIAYMRRQSSDFTGFRGALARRYDLTLDEIDALIAEGGPERPTDPETEAQNRLRMHGESARRDRAAHREWAHEEE